MRLFGSSALLSFLCLLAGVGEGGDISIGTGVDLLPAETDSFLRTLGCILKVSSDDLEYLDETSRLIGITLFRPAFLRGSIDDTLGLGIE